MCELSEKEPILKIKSDLDTLSKIYENKCRLCLNSLSNEQNEMLLICSYIESTLTYYKLAMKLTDIQVRYSIGKKFLNLIHKKFNCR